MGVVGLFFLLLFLCFVAYFFGGMLILKMRGASGLEIIPNYLFWITLPTKMKARPCIDICIFLQIDII